MSNASQESQAAPADAAPRKPRIIPGIAIWVVIAIFVGLAVLAGFQSEALGERVPMAGPAMSRIVIALMTVLSVFTLVGWLVFFSDHPVALKAFAVVLVLAFPVAFRFEHSGDLFSGRIHPRWRAPDRAMALPEVVAGTPATISTDLPQNDPNAFVQFLGPQRSGVLDHLRLSPRWESEQLWRKEVGAGWSGFAAYNGIAVTQEQRGDDELVVAYEISTSDTLWYHAEHGERHDNELGGVGPRATPTIHKGRVYTVGGTGVLNCLELGRREVVAVVGSDKKTAAALVAWGRAGSPLIVGEMVVVPGGGKEGKFTSLIGYRLSDGEPVWRAGNEQISYSSPCLYEINGVRQVVTMNEASVAGYAIEDGKQLWSYPRAGNSAGDANTSQPQLVDSDKILVSKGYGAGAELLRIVLSTDGAWSVESIWANKRALNTKLSYAIVVGDYAYGLNNGVLECVALSDGSSQWRKGRMGHGQLLAIENDLLVLSEEGELFRVKATPDGYEATEGIQLLDGICWNTLCVYGDTLLARNNREAISLRLWTTPVNTASGSDSAAPGTPGRRRLSITSHEDRRPIIEHQDTLPPRREGEEEEGEEDK